MLKRVILSIFLIVSFSYSNNDNFNAEIEEKLENDFNKLGIKYVKESNIIRFDNSGLLFLSGNNDMNVVFTNTLDFIYPKVLQILLNHKDEIENIYVKGYSSSENRKADSLEDKYQLNLLLSQKRADKVYEHLIKLTNKIFLLDDDKLWLTRKLIPLGMSSSKLIYNSDGLENKEKSRRIEIEIDFRDETIETPLIEEKIQSRDEQCTVYLADYVKKLLIENPTMQEQYEFLKVMQKDIDIVKAKFRPIVELNLKHTEYQESKPDQFTDIQSKDITVRYNIFNGFKDEDEININQYSYESNQYLKEQIEIDLIFTITQTFITIQKQKIILDLAKENLIDYDKWLSKESIKFQNGMVGLSDYTKVQGRNTMQRMNYVELQRQYKDSISTLQKYIDFDTEDIECFEKLKPNSKYLRNKDMANEDAQVISPYIKEANSNIRLYQEKIKQQNVNFYPTIDIIGKKSIYDENYESTNSVITNETAITLQAKIELYSGHKESNLYKKAQIEYKQKIKKRDEVVRDTIYKINLAFNKYDLVLSKEKLLSTLINKRKESFLAATYDYEFGKIDANELLNTVDSLYDAKRLFVENQYNMQIEEYKIFTTVGMIKDYILEDWVKE